VTPVWLEAQTLRLRAAFVAGRMPHALLIHEAPGAAGSAWRIGGAACAVRASAARALRGLCGV